MEKKPITAMLKVTSILHLIQAIAAVLAGILALSAIALPGLEEMVEKNSGIEITPLTYISLAIAIVCGIIDIVMSVMALKHKNLGIVYKISIFTMLLSEVFSATELKSVSDYVSIITGLIVPCLFLYAVFKQRKLDGEN